MEKGLLNRQPMMLLGPINEENSHFGHICWKLFWLKQDGVCSASCMTFARQKKLSCSSLLSIFHWLY